MQILKGESGFRKVNKNINQRGGGIEITAGLWKILMDGSTYRLWPQEKTEETTTTFLVIPGGSTEGGMVQWLTVQDGERSDP